MNILGLVAALAMFGLAPAAVEAPRETAAILQSKAAKDFGASCRSALGRMGIQFVGLGGPLSGCSCVAGVVTRALPGSHQPAALEALVTAILARNVTEDHRPLVYQRLRDIRARHHISDNDYQRLIGQTARALRQCS